MAASTVLRTALLAACFAVSLSSARLAHAEDPPGDPALAHEMFDQGRALMEQGDYDRACSKFEESRRLDPRGGGGTVLNLALCEEKRGKTGTAWALFRTARSFAVRDRREDRQQFADEHIAALAPRLSRLRIVVPSSSKVPGLDVHRNGIALPPSEWGEPLVVDPGTQIVVAKAPGYAATRIEGTAPEGETLTVSIPTPTPLPRETRKPSPVYRRRAPTVAEILVGGAGLTAIAVGTAFGVRAINRQHDADALCPDYDHCNPQGITLSTDAVNDGRISTVAFVGGVVLVAGAVVSYLFIGRTHVLQPATGASTFSIRF